MSGRPAGPAEGPGTAADLGRPRVGAGTTVRPLAHLRPGAVVGAECDVGEGALVDADVVIGDRVVVGPGARLCGALSLGDDVRVGPNATFADDPSSHEPYPGTPSYELRFGRTVVGRGAQIGAGATVLPGLSIGAYAQVGPGALVNTPVPAYAVVGGNPARIMAYVDARRVTASAGAEELPALHARGARLLRFPMLTDPRGVLSFGQTGDHLPFTPARYFLITDVPDGRIRGEHAHYEMEEIVVCAKGSFRVVIDDGRVREDVLIDSPSVGLYIPPLMWRIPYAYSPDAVLLALCSNVYEPEDYIRDYAEFLRVAGVAPIGATPEAP